MPAFLPTAPRIAELWGFAQFVARRFREDRCSLVAASLTYANLLALVPMFTIALTVMSAFPVFERLMAELRLFVLKNLVPEVAGRVIDNYAQQFSQNAAGLTTVGLLMLGVTALFMMFTIDDALNVIWRSRRGRPLIQRLLIYWTLLTLGPILVGTSISLTSYLIGVSKGWLGAKSGVDTLLLRVVPVVLTMLAFAMLYIGVPNRYVPRSHALIGAAIAAVLFELMKRVFAAYVAGVPTYSVVYGTFAAFPIFLLWLYLSWLVILAGAVIAASLSHWRGGVWRFRATPQRRFYDALRILRVLYTANRQQQSISLAGIRLAAPIGLEILDDILSRLEEAGFVRRARGRHYVLATRPESLRVSDVYRLFVLEADEGIAHDLSDDELSRLMHRLSSHVDANLDTSLETLFAQPAAESDRAEAE